MALPCRVNAVHQTQEARHGKQPGRRARRKPAGLKLLARTALGVRLQDGEHDALLLLEHLGGGAVMQRCTIDSWVRRGNSVICGRKQSLVTAMLVEWTHTCHILRETLCNVPNLMLLEGELNVGLERTGRTLSIPGFSSHGANRGPPK